MPKAWSHRLRRARRGLWYVLAGALVVMALVAGIVSQVVLPWAERHPERIEAWLSARAGRSVSFDQVETQWTRRGPLLRLDGMRIGDGADAVPIGAAEVLVSQYAGLLPGSSFTELRLRGLELTLQRGDDGRWQVRGLPGDRKPGGDPFSALEGLGELQVIGGRLHVEAPALGIAAHVPRIDMRLRVDGDRVRIGMRAWARAGAAPVEARAQFGRAGGDGRAYVAAKQVALAQWSPLLHAAGITVADGSGRIEAWTTLRDHRISSVTVDADLQALQLQGAALENATASRVAFGKVQLRGRWQAVDGGWRADAPLLRIGDGKDAQVLDGLVVAGGQRQALLAERIDAGPLLALAALSDRVAPGLRHWLLDARPDVVLHDVELGGAGGGRLRAHAGIEGLRFAAHGDAPGISGVAGTLDGDAGGLVFEFDPEATLRFDWPSGFGAPHDVTLRGRVAGWREGADWRVETPALRVDGDDYGADVRGGMTFEGDGTRPRIDMAARLDETRVPVARRFWVRYLMSEAALHWLDTALVNGRVLDGRAVVSGDLDDWPFHSDAHKGLFEATGRLAGAVVRFQPDWPAAEHIDADVAFVGNGFTVNGRGTLADVAIPRLQAGIADFGEADLRIDADAKADAGKLLALLRASPLHDEHAETLDNLAASGPTTAGFSLDLPLHHDAPAPKIAGRVELAGVNLAEKRWKLDFDEVRGAASYDHEGFSAGALRAVHLGQPGRLSLRAGKGHVREDGNAFEAEATAAFDAHELLDQAPDMAWLKPYVDGRSPWTIAVSIGTAVAGTAADTLPPTRLRLQSSLEGTRLALPAPLEKPAVESLPTTVETMLPLGAGDIRVAFGQRLALRARSAGNRTGVRVVLGSDRVAEAPPASGLIATGRTPTLDAIDWTALATGGKGGGSLPLRNIDIQVDRLLLLGGSFADARLRAQPSRAGTDVQVDSERLAGRLSIPDADGAPITGRFSRVSWAMPARPAAADAAGKPTAPASTAGAAGPPQATDNGAGIDPSAIPPLSIDIDELRLGELALGKAEVRTHPVPAGLRVDRLQAQSQKQRIDISGDWLGRGANARTRLTADVHSEDFGALLAGFGYGGRLAGGNGEARLDANWPGSPAGFQLAGLQGSLAIAIKEGQLVEVEPGAGRVLGLLSVAELPRRLMLDFRDLFSKGFAFNRIGGNIAFGGGQARSDDMHIDGPAAEIRIRGSADLRARTFDQHIDVLPRSGNLLTVAGALAGGPVGAAVGALTNAVLKKPLGEMGAKSYRVSGPWADPKVDVVSRGTAPEPPAPASGARPPDADTADAPQPSEAPPGTDGLPNGAAAPNSGP